MNDGTTASGAGGGSFDPVRLLNVVWNHIWVVLVVFALSAAGVFFLLRDTDVTYRSRAVLMIQPAMPPIIGDIDPAVAMWGTYLDAQRYRSTQLRIMTSRELLADVAEELNLGANADFVGIHEDMTPEERARRFENVDPVSRLQSILRVEAEQDTMMVNIVADCPRQSYCADLVNGVADAYLRFNYEQRISSGASAEDWIRQQYQQTREQLEDAEDRLYSFRRDRELISVSLDDQFNLTGQDLQALNGQLIEAEFTLDRLDTSMREVQRIRREGDYLSAGLTEVVDNTLVQSLKSELIRLEVERASLGINYLDEHPQMRANQEQIERVRETLEREIDAELSSLEIEYRTAESLVGTLRGKRDRTYEDAMTLGDAQLEYERIQREVESTRTIFDTLEQRLKEIELANQLEPNNVQVMERAMGASSPRAPAGSSSIMIALIVGLLLGVGSAFVLETLDSTVQTQEQLEEDFALTFLGMMPRIRHVRADEVTTRGPRKGEAFSADTFVRDFPKSAFAEAARTIRTNLMFLGSEKPLRRLLVTSSGPLEGKTTNAVSLATVLAQSGSRVLLVDSDMRRPRVHSALGLRSDAGFSTLLLGRATLQDVVQPSGIDGVDTLVCGPIPPNPTDLMYTARFKEVVESFHEHYDLVVFDSPPLGPVTDAAVLSRFVDGVIIVVRAGKTRKESLAHAVDQLDAVDAPIAGAILNDVDLSKRAASGYAYYRFYGEYYGTRDDNELA